MPETTATFSLLHVLLVVLLLMVIFSFPRWPHARTWGYAPSGLLAAILVILIVLALAGVL